MKFCISLNKRTIFIFYLLNELPHFSPTLMRLMCLKLALTPIYVRALTTSYHSKQTKILSKRSPI
jgi:hypothetical protein